MKPHFRDGASTIVRQQIEAALADSTQSAAHAWKAAADLAWSYGLDLDPPATPVTDKLNALRAAGDMREVNRLYTLQGANFISEQELRNVVRFSAMRKWASEASIEERKAEDLRRAADAAREAEIEARAQQILAEQNRAALEKARAQARKEMTHE